MLTNGFKTSNEITFKIHHHHLILCLVFIEIYLCRKIKLYHKPFLTYFWRKIKGTTSAQRSLQSNPMYVRIPWTGMECWSQKDFNSSERATSMFAVAFYQQAIVPVNKNCFWHNYKCRILEYDCQKYHTHTRWKPVIANTDLHRCRIWKNKFHL